METVRTAVTSLCVSMIFFGVVMMLVPEGTMHKSFKTFAAVAVISALITSLCGISSAVEELNFDFSDKATALQSSEMAETVNEQNRVVAEKAVSDLITENLSAAGIKNAETSVLTDISDDGGIYITEVAVVCDSSDADTCRKVLDALSVSAEIRERE